MNPERTISKQLQVSSTKEWELGSVLIQPEEETLISIVEYDDKSIEVVTTTTTSTCGFLGRRTTSKSIAYERIPDASITPILRQHLDEMFHERNTKLGRFIVSLWKEIRPVIESTNPVVAQTRDDYIEWALIHERLHPDVPNDTEQDWIEHHSYTRKV